MKVLNRALLILAAIGTALSVSAQPAILCSGDCAVAAPPVQADGSYQVQQVVEAEGKTAAQLYGAAKAWFASSYNSAQDVIQSDDPENFVLVGRAWSAIPLTVMGVTAEPQLWYAIKVEAKDGRARYTIYNMEYDANSGMARYRVPLSQAFFEERYQKGKKLNNRDQQLRRGWIENINSLAASIENALQNSASSENEW